jgi:hypothetical protein
MALLPNAGQIIAMFNRMSKPNLAQQRKNGVIEESAGDGAGDEKLWLAGTAGSGNSYCGGFRDCVTW